MSQVLEKPILLDETGQDISSKINGVGGKIDSGSAAIVEALDDIKDAIGTSTEFIPFKIQVASQPTKTSYMAGEQLDLAGLSVMLVATNGTMLDVTSVCTFSPADGATLTASDTSVAISYYYYKDDVTFTTSINLTITELLSITVDTPPTKTSYRTGELLDLTGMVVKANYGDGTSVNVTNQCTYVPANGTALTSSDTEVTISYTEQSVTKTATQAITVIGLVSIAVTTPPDNVEYFGGDTLDLTGIVVKATYTNGLELTVTNQCTYSPADGDELTSSDTSVTISYTEGGATRTTTQALDMTAIYGAEWDGTSTSAWSRTDDAASFIDPVAALLNGTGSSPFDTIQPWAGMTRVEDANAGTLVSIPKFYYKWTRDGAKMKLQICSKQATGFLCSPAHIDRGDGNGERDTVYVGAYCCDKSGGTFKSLTGTNPWKNGYPVDRDTARTSIHALGTDIWQWDYAMLWTIRMLYLVEYADWNSQAKIGYGGRDGYPENSGACDSMTYHTGTNRGDRTSAGHIRYRYIEDLWANINQWIDGIICYGTSTYIIKNPADFSGYNTSAGQSVSNGATSVGWIKSWTDLSHYANYPNLVDLQFALMPETTDRNTTTKDQYICDYWNEAHSSSTYYEPKIEVADSYQYQVGLFSLNRYQSRSSNDNYAGCRLMKLPVNS